MRKKELERHTYIYITAKEERTINRYFFLLYLPKKKDKEDKNNNKGREKRLLFLYLCGLGDTTNDLLFDTTLILATIHAEEALLTPVLVPAVGKKPVGSAVVDTIAQQLDSVVAEKTTADVMIDTRSVDDKVLIDSKAGLARTFLRKLGDDIVMTLDVVDVLAVVLVVLPGGTVLALTSAGRGRIIIRGARVLAARDVVIARGERIRTAILSHDTILLPVHESNAGLATVAATAARASKHILSAENDIGVLTDASTIADGSDRADSPAGTAGRLIADHPHGGAVVVITRIIGIRSVDDLSSSVTETPHVLGGVGETLRTSTKKSANLIMRKTRNRRRKGGSPELSLLVNRPHKVHSANTSSAGNNNSNSNKSKSLHC